MIEKLLNDLMAWVRTQPEVIALYLYGSQAEGRANVLSDLDLAVMVRPDLAQSQLWRLEDRWAAQWPAAVDLCLLNLAPLSLRYQITAQGQRLWTADVNRVAEIESLIWREYWDMHPKLEQDWIQFVTKVMEQKDEAEQEQYQAALAKVRAIHQRVREASAGYTGDVKK